MRINDYMRKSDGVRSIASVPENGHVLEALMARESVAAGSLDVVDHSGAVVGCLRDEDLLHALADTFGAAGGSLLEASCSTADYSASRMAHAVEDADTALLGMWTRPRAGTPAIDVVMHVAADDSSPACRSLRRYGYDARPLGAHRDDDLQTALANIDALKMYLDI